MSALFRFPDAVKRSPAVEAWLGWQKGVGGAAARRWWEVLRNCGAEVQEVLHDGHTTVCVGDAAFAYVDTFPSHVNLGFFRGAELPDPERMLEGSGKLMRHVKIRSGVSLDEDALTILIRTAYADMKRRVEREREG